MFLPVDGLFLIAFLLVIFFKDLFIHLPGSRSCRGCDVPSVGSLPDGCQGLELRVWIGSLFRVLLSQGAGMKWSSWGLNQCPAAGTVDTDSLL